MCVFSKGGSVCVCVCTGLGVSYSIWAHSNFVVY